MTAPKKQDWEVLVKKICLILTITTVLLGCSSTPHPPTPGIQARPTSGPLTTKNVEAVRGQKATCGGPADKTFNLDVTEQNISLGMGTTFAAWTYNGRIPAPTLEACEGDTVTINVTNKGTTAHGL